MGDDADRGGRAAGRRGEGQHYLSRGEDRGRSQARQEPFDARERRKGIRGSCRARAAERRGVRGPVRTRQLRWEEGDVQPAWTGSDGGREGKAPRQASESAPCL